MPHANSRDECPTAEEVCAALGRIAASDAFRACPQLVAFLRYVVDATLRGGQDRIKGYTIAVEALGRGDDFNPQDDPIVRVEAMRLRRALQRYYADGGRDDAVHIVLPLGSYVPVFRRAAAPVGRDSARDADAPIAQPMWRDFVLFLIAYLDHDGAGAAHYAARIPSDAYPLDLVARALVAAHHGETQTARQLLDRLDTTQPDWRRDDGAALVRGLPAEAIASRIARDLAQIEGVAAKP
jgi:hypothetical protein